MTFWGCMFEQTDIKGNTDLWGHKLGRNDLKAKSRKYRGIFEEHSPGIFDVQGHNKV